MTQNEMILKHIQQFGSITQGTAKNLYGCARLASRIHELREAGYPIEKEMIKVKAMRGTAYVARYYLDKGETHG